MLFQQVHRDSYAVNFVNNLSKYNQVTLVLNNLFQEQTNLHTSHFPHFNYFF